MKYTKSKEKQVQTIISKHKRVQDRIKELLKKGFKVQYVNVKVGGVGHLHTLKSEIRMQVGYAKGGGFQNYAEAVIFER
jgi:cysteine sulfinate desulfinase/cysteine desulfurase-like protein